MRPDWLTTKVAAVIAAGIAVVAIGSGALAIAIIDDDDDLPQTITVGAGPEPPPQEGVAQAPVMPAEGRRAIREVVVDDLIPPEDARRAASAAENEGGGTALTVDYDDGLYEVGIQRADGRLVEFYLDNGFRVVGSELEDDYNGFD